MAGTQLRTVVNTRTGEIRKVTLREATRWASAGWVVYSGKPIVIGAASDRDKQLALARAPSTSIVVQFHGLERVNQAGVYEVGVSFYDGATSKWDTSRGLVEAVGGVWREAQAGETFGLAPTGSVRGSVVQRGNEVRASGADGGTTEQKPVVGPGSALVNALRDAGWNNPDSVAANMMQIIAQSPNENLYKAAVSIASKFGGGMQDLGWETFMAEARTDSTTLFPLDEGAGGSLGLPPGGGGYGGYGGGSAGPVYVPPDRRVVEDMVRGQLATLVGRATPDRVQMVTDLYMTEHRRAWNKPELGLDPRASVTEKIRSFGDYQRIHKLRPDYMSEDEWVTAQQRTAVNAGMGAKRAEQFAINMAQAGTSLSDTQSAAGTSEFARGQNLDQFKQRLVTSARSLFEGIQ